MRCVLSLEVGAVASWEIEGCKSEGSMTVFVEHGVSCGGWDKVPLQEKAGCDNGSVLVFSGRESDGVDVGMRQQQKMCESNAKTLACCTVYHFRAGQAGRDGVDAQPGDRNAVWAELRL